eukprot:309959-Pelagomonas_calceolata.AAC.2
MKRTAHTQASEESHMQCSVTEALDQKDQARVNGWMPLWHLPIPLSRNRGDLHPIREASCALRPLPTLCAE